MSLRNLLSGSVDAPTEEDRPDRHSRFLCALSGVERELWFVALAAMLVDVTLTVHGLQLGLEELNPVARTALDNAGVLGLYALKSGAVLVGVACRPLLPAHATGLVPLGLALPSLCAVFINTTLIALIVT